MHKCESYLSSHMDMFVCLVVDMDHIDLYGIDVCNDEFDNSIIDYMARTKVP